MADDTQLALPFAAQEQLPGLTLAAAIAAVVAEQNLSADNYENADPVWVAESDRFEIARQASILALHWGAPDDRAPTAAEKALADIIDKIIALVGPWEPPPAKRRTRRKMDGGE